MASSARQEKLMKERNKGEDLMEKKEGVADKSVAMTVGCTLQQRWWRVVVGGLMGAGRGPRAPRAEGPHALDRESH